MAKPNPRANKNAPKRAAAGSQPHRGRKYTPPAERTGAPLDRTDLLVAGGVGAGAGAIFLSTFSSHVALGDAPESVIGVRSLGILHAPGYITYVAAARAFGAIVPLGNWELRVNLFSLVCAALTIAVVYLLARGLTAERIGSAIGALTLATTMSFWFNAGFAKYYAFSGLLVAAIALCAVVWQQRGGRAWLVIAGVLLGSSLGVSWQLAVIVLIGLAVMLFLGANRPGLGIVLVTAAAAVVTAVTVCIVILVRAHHDPVMNYGNATDFQRLVDLLTTKDFQGNRTAAGAGVGHFLSGVPSFFAIVARDTGLGAVALAFAGMFDLYERRRLDHALFLALVGIGNIVAVGLVSGFNLIYGFYTGLVMGGQLLGTMIVVALLAGLGASRIFYELADWQATVRRERRGPQIGPTRLLVASVGVIVLAVLAPSLLVHYRYADHRMPPLAEIYAHEVMAELPAHSVFLAGGWEYGQPILERQVIHHERPDISVVAVDNLPFEWYREQTARRLGLDPSIVTDSAVSPIKRYIDALRKTRPVYADSYAMLYGAGIFAYQPAGLVGRVVDGTGPKSGIDPATASAALRKIEARDGITSTKYGRFPNNAFYFFYERAHVEVAKAYALADNLDAAANELERALVFGPTGEDRSPITAARNHAANAKQIILNL